MILQKRSIIKSFKIKYDGRYKFKSKCAKKLHIKILLEAKLSERRICKSMKKTLIRWKIANSISIKLNKIATKNITIVPCRIAEPLWEMHINLLVYFV